MVLAPWNWTGCAVEWADKLFQHVRVFCNVMHHSKHDRAVLHPSGHKAMLRYRGLDVVLHSSWVRNVRVAGWLMVEAGVLDSVANCGRRGLGVCGAVIGW